MQDADGAPALARHSPPPEISSLPGTAPAVVTITGAPGTGVAELAAALRARLGPAVTIALAAQADDSAAEPMPEAASVTGAAAAPVEMPEAVAASVHAVGTLTLLTGLDIHCPPFARAEQEAADAALRAALARAGTDFRVVYGTGEQRIAHALRAIKSIAGEACISSATGLFDAKMCPAPPFAQPRRAAWSCEKCSDPECEHKLFTSLMGRAAGTEGLT
ncbi:hypothetical protein [Acidovorax sp. BL-A-41-H1]|uniref:hypothetical protein n=1 Tax=Acidovorax sp. BL-A-41-H1 TaxID=3421102 RepID=UPI003F78B8AC